MRGVSNWGCVGVPSSWCAVTRVGAAGGREPARRCGVWGLGEQALGWRRRGKQPPEGSYQKVDVMCTLPAWPWLLGQWTVGQAGSGQPRAPGGWAGSQEWVCGFRTDVPALPCPPPPHSSSELGEEPPDPRLQSRGLWAAPTLAGPAGSHCCQPALVQRGGRGSWGPRAPTSVSLCVGGTSPPQCLRPTRARPVPASLTP